MSKHQASTCAKKIPTTDGEGCAAYTEFLCLSGKCPGYTRSKRWEAQERQNMIDYIGYRRIKRRTGVKG